MKKIIELAEKATGDHKDALSAFASYQALKDALAKYKRLQQTPITEEWLKEHGWLQNGTTQEVLESCDWENCDDTWCHPASEISIYINYQRDEIMFYQNCDNAIYINNTLVDLYNACELCGIELN